MRRTRPETPVNDFLKQNKKKHPASFHMPGHKYRAGGISSTDITEIPGADNIRKPEGIIRESLAMVSRAYGSSRSFYLTNGTTQGIHAVMRYAALHGKKIIVSRDCHMSAVNGAAMFGVTPVFAESGFADGIPRPVDPETVRKAVDENRDACGILITSPNYYGITADITGISGIAHEAGMFLAVDEAHGAHFEFAGMGGSSGIRCGADIVCHSLHKTLPVYNQGAVLHVCGSRIDENIISAAVNMTGTTSPSYPLIASMEAAVARYSTEGRRLYERLRAMIGSFRSGCPYGMTENDDFTRIVLEIPGNGFAAASALHDEHSVDPESADFDHIVCLSTPMNTRRDFRRLKRGLKEFRPDGETACGTAVPGVPEAAVPIDTALRTGQEYVPLDMALNRICGTIIVSYPPGTPVLCPGEIIDGYALAYIEKIMESGGTVLGIEDKKIPVLELT